MRHRPRKETGRLVGSAWSAIAARRRRAKAILALTSLEAVAYACRATNIRRRLDHAADPRPDPSAPGRIGRVVVVGTVLAALATASWVGVRALTGSRSVLTPVQACPPWQFVDAPSLGGYNNFLYGAASAGPDDVWAVGSRITELGNAALAEHWTGTSWGTVTGPSVGRYDSLYAVAAASPRDVWAVGATETDHIGRTLTVHWDGSRWSLVPSPSPSPSYSQLFGISAVASNDVWAVGTYRAAHPVGSGGLGPFRNLIEHWDGTRWTVIATPNTTPKDSWVNAVSPVAADDVWAVGQTTSTRTLALHWDGRRWRVVPTPNRDRASVLQSVSALASSDVWAVRPTPRTPPRSPRPGRIGRCSPWGSSTAAT